MDYQLSTSKLKRPSKGSQCFTNLRLESNGKITATCRHRPLKEHMCYPRGIFTNLDSKIWRCQPGRPLPNAVDARSPWQQPSLERHKKGPGAMGENQGCTFWTRGERFQFFRYLKLMKTLRFIDSLNCGEWWNTKILTFWQWCELCGNGPRLLSSLFTKKITIGSLQRRSRSIYIHNRTYRMISPAYSSMTLPVEPEACRKDSFLLGSNHSSHKTSEQTPWRIWDVNVEMV